MPVHYYDALGCQVQTIYFVTPLVMALASSAGTWLTTAGAVLLLHR